MKANRMTALFIGVLALSIVVTVWWGLIKVMIIDSNSPTMTEIFITGLILTIAGIASLFFVFCISCGVSHLWQYKGKKNNGGNGHGG